MVATLIVLITISTVTIAFAEKLVAVPNIWRRLWSSSPISFEAGVYLWEVANVPSETQTKVFVEEIREFSSGCSILTTRTEPNAEGMWASPLPEGARANVLLKIRLRNISPEKLTNLRVGLSPAKWPVEFKTMNSTPNVNAKLTRSAPDSAGRSTYTITIDSLTVDDFAVVTLSAPLTRESAKKIPMDRFDMMVLSIQADQIASAMPKVAIEKSSPMALYFQEGLKTTGRLGFGFGSEIILRTKEEAPRAEDHAFLPPSKECDGEGRPLNSPR